MFGQILRPLARRALPQVGMQVRHDSYGHGHSKFKYPTLDECCNPEGSWKDNYNKLQKKYNAVLVFGVAFFAVSVTTILQNELIFFNYLPPKVLDVSDFKIER